MSFRLFKKSRISWQLLFWFLIIEIPAGILLTYVGYIYAEESLKTQVTNNLDAVARRQANQIYKYLSSQIRNTEIIASLPDIIKATSELSSTFSKGGIYGEEYLAKEEEWRRLLVHYQSSFQYEDFLLVSPNGDVVFSVRSGKELGSNLQSGEFRDTEVGNVFKSSLEMLQSEISGFSNTLGSAYPAAYISTPILDGMAISGVLMIKIDNAEISNIVNDYAGLGNTGESVLVSKQGRNAVFTSNTRHDPNAAFQRKVSMFGTDAPTLVQAARGEKGNGITIDYRNESVLAVWSFMPIIKSGLVVKIDTTEAYEPIVRLRNVMLLITLAIFLAVVFVAIFVARSISKPIMKLTDVARSISGGNLNQKVSVKATNEIGTLASSFNLMTDRLAQSETQLKEYNKNLETKVEERTDELKEKNILLEKIDEIVQSINEKVQLEDVLQVVLAELRTLERVDAATVLMKHSEDEGYLFKSSVGEEQVSDVEKAISLAQVKDFYIKHGEIVTEGLYHSQNLYEKIGKKQANGLYLPKALLTLQIMAHGDLLGYIMLFNQSDANAFVGNRVKSLLQNLKPHITSVFSKAQVLYELEAKNLLIVEQSEELQTEKEQLSVMNQEMNKTNTELHDTVLKVNIQNKEIEEKNTKIISSIQYAKRIQSAILPPLTTVQKHLTNSFVYFQPRDIVSGDFYWCANLEGETILAAVDCTGHGVPGAFMSMIGSSLLNQIVYLNHVTAPHKILTALNIEIRKALKQEETTNQDSMDIAICTIHHQTNTIEFAGARNPLFCLENGTLEMIKGDRMSVGGSWYGKHKEFELHTIQAKPNQQFYIFSDGFRDQFGGKSHSKLMMKGFRSLISDISKHPFEEQEILLKDFFNNWKGKQRQTDDVLVIGFQLA